MSMRMFPEKTGCSQQLSEDSPWIWVVPSNWQDTWMAWKEGETCSLSFSLPEWVHLLLLLLDNRLQVLHLWTQTWGFWGWGNKGAVLLNLQFLTGDCIISLLFWGFHLLELSCYWYLWPFKLHTVIIKLSGLCDHVSQSDKPSPILKYMLLVLFFCRMLTNTTT